LRKKDQSLRMHEKRRNYKYFSVFGGVALLFLIAAIIAESLLMVAVVAFSIVILAIMLISLILRERRIDWLIANGEEYDAEVIGVETCVRKRYTKRGVKRITTYCCDARIYNQFERKAYHAMSEGTDKDLRYMTGKKVKIYVDRDIRAEKGLEFCLKSRNNHYVDLDAAQ